MTAVKKFYLKVFAAGAAFGVLGFGAAVLFEPLAYVIFNSPVAFIVHLTDINPVLEFFCRGFQSDACRGLGLDGGPLEWIEWTWFALQFMCIYGIVFCLIAAIVKKIRPKKQDITEPA